MARLFLVLLSLVAAFAGAAHLYAGSSEQVEVVGRYVEAALSPASRGFPLASKDDGALSIARTVAKRTSFQFALADVAARGERPDGALLEQARLSVHALAGADHPVVVVGTSGGVRGVRAEGEVQVAKDELAQVADALAGGESHGFSLVEGRLHRLLAVPVSTGALAVALPVDDAFAKGIAETLGVDVTFVQGGKAVASSLSTMDRAELVVAAGSAGIGSTFGVGSRPAAYGLAEVVELPLFAPWPGTTRAVAATLPGASGGTVVYSVPVRKILDPFVEAQKRTLLLAGLTTALGLFLATIAGGGGRRRDANLRKLADVTERAAEGDATAQASEALPGDLGRLARSINRLSQRNRLNHKLEPSAAPPALPTEDPIPSFPFGQEEAVAEPEAVEPKFGPAGGVEEEQREEEPTFGFGAFATEPTQRDAALPFVGGDEPAATHAPPPGFEAGAAPALAAAQQEPAQDPAQEPGEEPSFGGPSWDLPTRPLPSLSPALAGEATTRLPQELIDRLAREQAAAQEVAAVAAQAAAVALASPAEEAEQEDPEEAHLREVFERFLLVRQECGESSAGIQYERFATKLRANRAQLVEKYRCSTVRFTVYVKEGRAALKATPVR